MNQSGRRAVDMYRNKPNKMADFLKNRETKYDRKMREAMQGNIDESYLRCGIEKIKAKEVADKPISGGLLHFKTDMTSGGNKSLSINGEIDMTSTQQSMSALSSISVCNTASVTPSEPISLD